MKKKTLASLALLAAALTLSSCTTPKATSSALSSTDVSSSLPSSASTPTSSSSSASTSSIASSSAASSTAASSSSSSASSSASISFSSNSLAGDYYAKVDLTQTGASLRTSLGSLLNNAAYSIPSYEALKITLPQCDLDPNGSGKMLGFYDETKLPTKWDDQDTWNREHVWPKSWGSLGTSGPGADPHMLRPASVSINSDRHNYYYGLSSDGSSYWDPGQYLEKYRGIAARICFYMATRYWKSYGLDLAETATAKCMGKKSRLLEWNKTYPIDATEIHRNEVLYKLYNVRNPFIDYPSLATSIWGN